MKTLSTQQLLKKAQRLKHRLASDPHDPKTWIEKLQNRLEDYNYRIELEKRNKQATSSPSSLAGALIDW
jgi:hypothetical protein